MDIAVLGIDLGKRFAAWRGWMRRAKLCFASASSGFAESVRAFVYD
ncbi:hypothetical protein BXY70_3661 [Roseovarius halotolerans]|nr:hypothetical protein BXY70_3661 [Roseovarius halotolerans]